MARHVDALPETGDREEARFVAGAELLDDALARKGALHEDLGVESRRHRLGDPVHHRTIGEECQRATAGRGDEFDEFFDDRRFGVRSLSFRKVGGHVEQGVGLVVEGTGEVLDHTVALESETLRECVGNGGARQHRGDRAPEVVVQPGADVDEIDLDVDLPIALGQKEQLAVAHLGGALEVVTEVDCRAEGADLLRLTVGPGRVERAQRFDDLGHQFIHASEFSRALFVEARQFVVIELALQ